MINVMLAAPLIGMAMTGHAPSLLADEPKFRYIDDFEERLSLEFQPIRHDKEMVSLEKNPGKLTITTQRGTLGGDETRKVPARNLYLIRNPVESGRDFVMTTCVESFKPTLTYQQAGILAYDDDDNYLKYDMEFGGEEVCFKFMHETKQVRTLETDDAVPESDRVWIRLTKRGDVYERSYSVDGERYVSVGQQSWGTGDPKWLGLIAVNGGARDEGLDAVFDFLEIRSLTPQEKNDPRALERKKLSGAWKVASYRANGKPLADSPITEVVFRGTRVTIAEQEQAMTLDFTLDPSQTPKKIVMYSNAGREKIPADGIYEIDGDELLICLAQPGAPAPTKLATEKGDSRLLLTLHRATQAAQADTNSETKANAEVKTK
jgi:uncharacterized protein (TIGR03067 family)